VANIAGMGFLGTGARRGLAWPAGELPPRLAASCRSSSSGVRTADRPKTDLAAREYPAPGLANPSGRRSVGSEL